MPARTAADMKPSAQQGLVDHRSDPVRQAPPHHVESRLEVRVTFWRQVISCPFSLPITITITIFISISISVSIVISVLKNKIGLFFRFVYFLPCFLYCNSNPHFQIFNFFKRFRTRHFVHEQLSLSPLPFFHSFIYKGTRPL